MERLSDGAEAIIYKDGNIVVKERIAKEYRLSEIDQSLRKFRTRREAKVIAKLNEIGVRAPKLISVCDSDMKINMEFISGERLRDCLDASKGYEVGQMIAQMHANDIVHGDLTTSNMIQSKNGIYFIDFGLSSFSKKVEDKAVDLHLIQRALESRHSSIFEDCFCQVKKGYLASYNNAKLVLDRLDKVQMRGRNKAKV